MGKLMGGGGGGGGFKASDLTTKGFVDNHDSTDPKKKIKSAGNAMPSRLSTTKAVGGGGSLAKLTGV